MTSVMRARSVRIMAGKERCSRLSVPSSLTNRLNCEQQTTHHRPGGFTSFTVAPWVSLRMRRESFSTLLSSAGLSIW